MFIILEFSVDTVYYVLEFYKYLLYCIVVQVTDISEFVLIFRVPVGST